MKPRFKVGDIVVYKTRFSNKNYNKRARVIKTYVLDNDNLMDLAPIDKWVDSRVSTTSRYYKRNSIFFKEWENSPHRDDIFQLDKESMIIEALKEVLDET